MDNNTYQLESELGSFQNGRSTEIQDDAKPLFSNKVQRGLLLGTDLIGLVGFLLYCYYLQSYFSTFYLLIMLVLIQFTWETDIDYVGMFEKRDSKVKKYLRPREFLKSHDLLNQAYQQRKTIQGQIVKGEEELEDELSEIVYKPLYWFVYKDVKKYLWIMILIVSTAALIMKGVMIGLLATKPNEIQNSMKQATFEGLEVFFSSNNNQVSISTKNYILTFLPNSLVFLFSCFVMAIRRVNNKRYLEEFNQKFKTQIYNFYFVIIWLLLSTIVSTNIAIIGYIIFTIQFLIVIRLFIGSSHYDSFIITITKYGFYILLTVLYLYTTPSFKIYIQNRFFTAQFYGVDIFYNSLSLSQWNGYVFFSCSLLLFTLLCILQELYSQEKIKLLYKPFIQDCVENYETYQLRKQQLLAMKNSEILKSQTKSKENISNVDELIPELPDQSEQQDFQQQQQQEQQQQEQQQQQQKDIPLQDIDSQEQIQARMSHIEDNDAQDKQQFMDKFNYKLLRYGQRLTDLVDQPVVTLRILQLLAISIVVMQKTYESLFLVIWILITGFTLKREINQLTTILLAIPSIFMNYITFYYANIPSMNQPNNPYLFCYNTNICPKAGFFYNEYSYVNIFIMNLTFFLYFLFLKQADEEILKLATIQKRQKEGLHFLAKKQKDDPSWWIIMIAILLKTSYVISLIIVYWIGFLDVNFIQFILVLFLLIFLINDSTLCNYKVTNKKSGKTKEYIVPFAFKYWIGFISYVTFIIVIRYIYLLFYQATVNSDWIMALIGIDSRSRYEIVFWVLFYFVALQYDSYKTKIYLKYSNNIISIIVLKAKGKEQQEKINNTMGVLQLIFMKGVIWLSFGINICFILFTPFSIINLILLVIVGSYFIAYTVSFTNKINYGFMSKSWYLYLNLLILTFIVRYFFQLFCLPNYEQLISSGVGQFYQTIQFRYFAYGLYQYDQSRLRLEYLPDIITIFFGALSLNTYRFLNSSQIEMELESKQNKDHTESQISMDSEIGGEEKLLERKQKQDIKQIAQIMQTSILDENRWMKKPLIFLAEINTDILTLFVVVSVVFYVQSIAAFIILILYLSYFLIVHNTLLNLMKQKDLLQRMSLKSVQLSANYLNYNDHNLTHQQTQFEQKELENMVKDIALTRLRIRIQKKESIWKFSFGFTCFCVLLTYTSQILSLLLEDTNYFNNHSSAIKQTSVGLFVFGTYSQEIYGNHQCFCGANDLDPECSTQGILFSTTIFEMVLFYLILVFANVVDAGCTQLLKDEMKKEEEEIKKTEEEKINERKLEKQKLMEQQLKSLDVIEEVEEPDNKDSQMHHIDEFQKDLNHFKNKYQYFSYEITETYTNLRILTVEDYQKIKKQSIIINYYNNKQRSFQLDLSQASFILLQRVFVLILLCNVILVNNIFSLVYLFVAAYLFRQKSDSNNMKILNTFSVFAIWIQYIMLNILNYKPSINKIPQNFGLIQQDFSVIQRIGIFQHQYLLSYFGFDNGEIMQCDYLDPLNSNTTTTGNSTITISPLFSYSYCVSNHNLEWVFVMNTFVLIMIYLYFLLVQKLAQKILNISIKMEQDQQFTQEILAQLYEKYSIKIKLNYQLWKNRIYSILQTLINNLFKINHVLTVGFIILLAQTNKVVINYIEFFIALSFLYIFEFTLKWTQRQQNLKREYKFFQVLFYIPVVSIALFTILKFPYILNSCAEQTKTLTILNINNSSSYSQSASSLFQFFCLEIFDVHIVGMVIIMLFVTLHFDTINSQSFEHFLNRFAENATQRAKMISLALAYDKNYNKYKEILRVQEQKEKFNQIQTKAQQKLQVWHSKLLDQQPQDAKEELAEIENKVQPLEKEIVQNSNLTKTQKGCIAMIKYFQEKNNHYKFMGLPNIMDYLMAQNIILNRKIVLTIQEFMKEDYKKFDNELQFLQGFIQKVFVCIQRKQWPINLEQIINEMRGQKVSLSTSVMKSQNQWKKVKNILGRKKVAAIFDQQQSSKQQKTSIKDYQEYIDSQELCFIDIADEDQQILIIDTKHNSSLDKQTTGTLMLNAFIEFLHLIVSYWISICYLMIIFYYIKNSGLLGGFLPLLLFLWVLIDEKAASKIFWLISYVSFSIITLVVFGYALQGMNYAQLEIGEISTYTYPWFYPLYDSNGGIVMEGFIILFIIIQVNLSKTQGCFENSIQDVENIFQGYIRMKINKLQIYITKILKDQINAEFRNQEEEEQQQQQQQQLLNSSTIFNQQFTLDQTNNIEKRITQDPNLLFKQYSFGERIFSYKFSRPGVDLYPLTASLQIFIVLYTLLFFSSMTQSGQKINNILKTNQIPASLIWALFIEIILMVLERYVTLTDSFQNIQDNPEQTESNNKKQKFLEKYKLQYLLKYLLLLVTVTLVYWFIFFQIGQPWTQTPNINTSNLGIVSNTTISFITNGYAICFFLLYSSYFTVSALQLRFGYQQLKLRNTVFQQYNQASYLFAKTFYAIPFLFELKVLMDWTFLETSLDVFQWFRLEDIQGIMYFTKNQSMGYLQRPLGLKIPKIMKCGMGCTLVLFILLCIFGPLILFSTLNPSSQLNLVNGGEFVLYLKNLDSGLNVLLYSTNQFYGLGTVLEENQINEALNQTCDNQIINNAPKQGALQEFQLISYSNTNWDISQPLFNQLYYELDQTLQQMNAQENDPSVEIQYHFQFNVTFSFTRQQEKVIPIKNYFSYPGNEGLLSYPGQSQMYLNSSQLKIIYDQFTCSNERQNLFLPSFYIQTMQLYSADGTSFKPRPIQGDGVNSVEDAVLAYNCSPDTIPTIGPSWWNLSYTGVSPPLNQGAGGLIMFVVSDTYSPLTYGFSIITIYTSVILLIGSFIRSLFSGQVWLLEYTGMVYPDDLLMICEAISIVRSQKDFKKENTLYFELIDILRSPEIVKIMTGSWTKSLKRQQKLQEEQAQINQEQQQI